MQTRYYVAAARSRCKQLSWPPIHDGAHAGITIITMLKLGRGLIRLMSSGSSKHMP